MYNSDVPLDAHPTYEDDTSAEEPEQPSSVHAFLAAVRAADALLICSPTYHGTISGAVKNALDYLEFMGGDTPRYLGRARGGFTWYGRCGGDECAQRRIPYVRTTQRAWS